MSTVTITQFSDPMMGLSWECEPVPRQVETHFGSQVARRDVMGLLVRDVADFMTPEERMLPEAEGLARYNARLAQIYLQEESLAGMPINMEGFSLFAPDRRTSLPLCLAYEAVAATKPGLAPAFLYRLRYATVVECRPTTKLDELVRVAELCGLRAREFLNAYRGSEAQDLLYRDLALKEQLGIFGLPAFVVGCGNTSTVISGVPVYHQLVQAIAQVSKGATRPWVPQPSTEELEALLEAHPLMPLVEVTAALELPSEAAAEALVQQLVEAGRATILQAPKGRFLRCVDSHVER